MIKKLNLVLADKYFQMTGEPGKMYELRKGTNWIKSRLLTSNGAKKEYDIVEICNGYKKGRETKIRRFDGFDFLLKETIFDLPNGEKYIMHIGDIIIYLS